MSMLYGAALQQQQQNAPKVDVPSTYAAIAGVSNSGREAIREAQKVHPEYYPKTFTEALENFNDKVASGMEDALQPGSPPKVQSPTSAPKAAKAKTKPETIDYFNADIAKKYGMSKSTAYQEALSNTSYQRSVKDMQAAGLNPAVLFGGGRATPANSAVYAAEENGSGSGGYSFGSGGRSGSSGNGKLFSGSAYSFIQALGGLVGIATTKKPDGFWIGSQTAKGAMGLLDALFK